MFQQNVLIIKFETNNIHTENSKTRYISSRPCKKNGKNPGTTPVNKNKDSEPANKNTEMEFLIGIFNQVSGHNLEFSQTRVFVWFLPYCFQSTKFYS
jgi:hypothetical protein